VRDLTRAREVAMIDLKNVLQRVKC
jgi:hypothetical protein